jgi:hypothetical protein
MQGVIPNVLREFKCDAVLGKIPSRFFGISRLELHHYKARMLTIMYLHNRNSSRAAWYRSAALRSEHPLDKTIGAAVRRCDPGGLLSGAENIVCHAGCREQIPLNSRSNANIRRAFPRGLDSDDA